MISLLKSLSFFIVASTLVPTFLSASDKHKNCLTELSSARITPALLKELKENLQLSKNFVTPPVKVSITSTGDSAIVRANQIRDELVQKQVNVIIVKPEKSRSGGPDNYKVLFNLKTVSDVLGFLEVNKKYSARADLYSQVLTKDEVLEEFKIRYNNKNGYSIGSLRLEGSTIHADFIQQGAGNPKELPILFASSDGKTFVVKAVVSGARG